MYALNVTTGKELASSMVVASTLVSRMRGLLGRAELASGEGMLIRPCKGVHTFGMGFPIDVVFLDETNRVVACKKRLVPNRLTSVYLRAVSVLELPAGMIDVTATEIGNQLELA